MPEVIKIVLPQAYCVKCGAMMYAEYHSSKKRMELKHPKIYGCPFSLRVFMPTTFEVEETDV